MNQENLTLECSELRELAEENMTEMEVIVEMLIESGEELCIEDAA